jgi:zinc/manganese transport system substrate-binding protein
MLFLVFAVPAHAALNVVASFSILGDVVRQVGGDKVAVTTLVSADNDAHVFQPSPKDGKKIADAKIVFINGLGFEGWMERLIQTADYKGRVVVVSDGVDALPADPHAWQNVNNVRKYVANVATALSQVDAVNGAYYKEKAVVLDKELAALDMWVKTEIANVPVAKRKVITSHDAFGYFAKAYGVMFLSPVGINTDAEPSAKNIAGLIKDIKVSGVKILFVENLSNPKIIQQLAQEAGASVGVPLYADALSPAGGVAATYQNMVRYNVRAWVGAMMENN